MRWTRRADLPSQLLLGALAGGAATWAMNKTMSALYRRASEETKRREQAVSPSEGAPQKAGRLAAEKLGFELSEEKKAMLGGRIHWGYGIGWGALYALLRNRFPAMSSAAGLAFGLALWFVGDEVVVPALRLSPPPTRYPLNTHVRALAAHLVYGAGVEGGYSLLERTLR